MKRLLNLCWRHRRSIALLAADRLPAGQRDRVEQHLAGCACCREYQAELNSVTDSLARWADNVSPLHPTPEARDRWAAAIRAAAGPIEDRPPASAPEFNGWWHDVVWSSRRVWAGLAVVWVLIAAGNVALREHPQATGASSSLSSKEMIMAFRDQQAMLAELLAEHGPASVGEADRPKSFVPRPRTEFMKDERTC